MTILYGIKSCDTVKKTRAWLEKNAIPYQFHDYKTDGINQTLLNQFASELGWEVLLNKRSTTWRQLSDAQKTNLNSSSALQLLLENPTLIKRPILKRGATLLVGFHVDDYQRLL